MNETLDKFYGETGETGESVFIHFWFKIFCVSNGCLKSDNILSFKTALQIQYRFCSRNLAHGSWNFWYLIEVQTILEKCVVFFSPKRS